MEQITKAVIAVLPFLLPLLFSRLVGLRTKIKAVLEMIIGTVTFITGGFLPYLCATFGIACDVDNTKFMGALLAVMGVVNYIYRYVTELPADDISNVPHRLIGGERKVDAIQRLKRRVN